MDRARPLHVFVLPSWYPHRCFPLEGIFLRDQAVAIAQQRPDWKVTLSLWNQGSGRLSLTHFRRSPRCLVEGLHGAADRRDSALPNLLEVTTPAPSWSEGFLHGNRQGILTANRRNLERAVRAFGPVDLLHAHVSYPAGWVAMRLGESTALPYVVTEHMGPFPLPVYAREDGTLPPFIREPLVRAAARMAVSPSLCDRVASFGIPRLEPVPNVVDERLYAPDSRPARQPGAPFGFFTLCQMERVKAIPDLLRAIRLLVDGLPATRRDAVSFRLGGFGTQFDAFRAESERLDLGRWVTWLGFLSREAARDEYRRCDAFVLPSHHESFGVVLVEAAAFGKPVVATRCGGPESIVDATNGILVAPGDPPAIARALAEVMDGVRTFDPAVIRDGFLRTYSRAAVVDRLEGIYRQALDASPRPGGGS